MGGGRTGSITEYKDLGIVKLIYILCLYIDGIVNQVKKILINAVRQKELYVS